MGRKYLGEEGEGYNFGEMLKELLTLAGSFPVRDFIPWLGWLDILSGLDARVRKCSREFDGFLERVIDEHKHYKVSSRNDEEESNFVDVLLSLNEKDGMAGISLTRDNMKAIILDMFAAGTDTTYTVIEWVMAELIKNPDVMKRVQEEVRGITLCSGEIKEESIDRMKYLKAVIKETLRLHPPVPLLVPRETMEEVELQGYHIPAGTRVIVNAWAIGRDPRSWDKPEEFYPERFVNCDIDFKGQDFMLIPFGAGRRGCPGIEFAMATIEITLAHLLGHFDWELADEMQGEVLDMSESPGLTAPKRSSLVLVAKLPIT
ncbi:cytochrome P450 71A1-like isoform X2 [Asparagus officinalis]|nr:cytochrome P450 71A1-like isoform X2 [Asparagus officinalis]